MEFRILKKMRPDGVACFFFQIDGETRHSSYDEKCIKSYALGYAGREVEIVEGE